MRKRYGDHRLQSVNKATRHARVRRVAATSAYWPGIAQLWEEIGPPLRPSAQDIAFLGNVIASWAHGNDTFRALILGVTPELYQLPWPSRTELLAVDCTLEMINNVWLGPRNSVICSDWTALPLKAGSCEMVLCDGGLHLLAYPQGQRKLVKTLHRVIASSGLCIFRLFIPPKEHESYDEVLQDLLEAKIPNLNQLKLRLWMALHEDTAQGLQLKRVWDAIHRVAPDLNRLALQIGWPAEDLLVLNTYRNCLTRYFFLSLDDIRDLFCKSPGGFTFESVHMPTYELGGQCPTVVLRRIDTAYVCGEG